MPPHPIHLPFLPILPNPLNHSCPPNTFCETFCPAVSVVSEVIELEVSVLVSVADVLAKVAVLINSTSPATLATKIPFFFMLLFRKRIKVPRGARSIDIDLKLSLNRDATKTRGFKRVFERRDLYRRFKKMLKQTK